MLHITGAPIQHYSINVGGPSIDLTMQTAPPTASFSGQASETSFQITELTLDHPERVFNFRPDLRFGFFDLSLGIVKGAALAPLLVGAAPCRDVPDDLATIMLGTLLIAGIAGIGTDRFFVAVQQFIDLSDIGHIGCRAHRDMGLHAEVPLIAFLDLMHFRVTLTAPILGRSWRIDRRGIDVGPLAQRQTTPPQITVDHCKSPCRQLVLFQQTTELEDGGFVRNALQAPPPQTRAESSFRTGLLPPQDRCSRTSFAAGEYAASPPVDRPDDRPHPSGNAVRSE